ncbi:MAG TPA: VWA domain-containing protein [Acidimicrobiia bacterium]
MSRPGLIDQLSVLSSALRARGLVVTSDQTADMARALTLVDLTRRSQARASLCSLSVTDPGQIPIFDEEFDRFFDRITPPAPPGSEPEPPGPGGSSYGLQGTEGTSTAEAQDRSGASAVKRIAGRDFADLDEDDLQEARRLVMTMMWHPTDYRTRRWSGARAGTRPDLRRTLRDAVGPSGDMMPISWKQRQNKERPLIIIADISGSMEKYADIFLVFAHAAQRRLRSVEIFTFSTHLSRITEEMRRRDTRTALALVAEKVTDWSGGTQIGEALGEWNRRWSRRLARGGPVLMVLSDGWDCGDPQTLSTEMGRLARSVHQVIWLNPLAARASYQPLTRGMQAVLPHVDQLLPAASVNDFRGVVRVLDSVAGVR